MQNKLSFDWYPEVWVGQDECDGMYPVDMTNKAATCEVAAFQYVYS